MDDNRLEKLLGALGLSFPDVLGRFLLLRETREGPAEKARTFLAAALEHPDVPSFVKEEIATEIVWWRFADLAPVLTSLVEETPRLALQLEALVALEEGSPCVCEVYATRSATSPSPRMEVVGGVPAEHPQVEECEYRCVDCGASWVHRQEHHERGATLHRWRRVEGGES